MRETTWTPVSIKKLEYLEQSYLILTIERPVEFHFHSGQYATLRMQDGDEVFTRAYSIASSPGLKDRLEFCLQILGEGKGSAYLKSLKVQDQLELSPPGGRFKILETLRPLVFVAGGSGIGPIRSFVKDLFSMSLGQPVDPLKVRLLYGCKSSISIPFKDEFKAFQSKFSNQFEVQFFSEAAPHLNGITQDVIEGNPVTALQNSRWELDFRTADYYLCGPPLMIQAVRQVLLERSVRLEQIFVDDPS